MSFAEALTALADPAALTVPDLVDPEITIGVSAFLRVLFVVHTERARQRRIRLISARKASAAQRKKYEEA